MKIGDKVTYFKFKKEKGIIKNLCDDDHVFVVYNCDNNWENYHNYTAARTKISDLKLGW